MSDQGSLFEPPPIPPWQSNRGRGSTPGGGSEPGGVSDTRGGSEPPGGVEGVGGGLSDPTEDLPGLARADARPTSRAAAFAVMPRTGTQRWRVLSEVALCSGSINGGLTDEELQDRLEMNANTERPRRVELVDGGWIEPSEIVRRTAAGGKAVVWKLTLKARAAFGLV